MSRTSTDMIVELRPKESPSAGRGETLPALIRPHIKTLKKLSINLLKQYVLKRLNDGEVVNNIADASRTVVHDIDFFCNGNLASPDDMLSEVVKSCWDGPEQAFILHYEAKPMLKSSSTGLVLSTDVGIEC